MAREDSMGKINWGRVLLGGLLAGVVNNLLQFILNRLYLFREWGEILDAESEQQAGAEFPWLFVALNLLAGVFVVWLYAMIRPRCGPGPKTAALAGLVFWLVSAMGPITLWSLSGMFPPIPAGLWATHLGTYLGIAIVMSLAGAWPYKE